MKRIVLWLIILSSVRIYGQIWSFNFSGTTNPANSFNPYNINQSTASNITVSGLGFNSGTGSAGVLAHTNTNNEFNTVGWSSTFNSNEYLYFTITPSSNYWVNITSFNYSGNTTGSGPNTFLLRSSLDNFNSNIGTIGASGSVNFDETFIHITSSISFRIYAYGATSANGAFGITGFSFNGSVALPIQLASFDLSHLNGKPTVTWSSLSEQNNHYYSLERSTDAKVFTEIKKIHGFGTGTTDKKIEYKHIDLNPLPGTNYYRLRQVDLDGTQTIYPAKSIFIAPEKTIVFPSMFHSSISILFTDPPSLNYQWQLINTNGQLITRGQFSDKNVQQEISFGDLVPGVYSFLINGKEGKQVFKLIKT